MSVSVIWSSLFLSIGISVNQWINTVLKDFLNIYICHLIGQSPKDSPTKDVVILPQCDGD